MKDGFTLVAGQLVSDAELELLHELAGGDDTARSLAVNVGPNGWTVLRRLLSLEARGLTAQYVHESGLLTWQLTPTAALAVVR